MSKVNLGKVVGNDGKSAYEIWLEKGNTGTEQDFLDSLVGKDGVNGIDGKSAYQIWLEQGNEGTEEEFIASFGGGDYEAYHNMQEIIDTIVSKNIVITRSKNLLFMPVGNYDDGRVVVNENNNVSMVSEKQYKKLTINLDKPVYLENGKKYVFSMQNKIRNSENTEASNVTITCCDSEGSTICSVTTATTISDRSSSFVGTGNTLTSITLQFGSATIINCSYDFQIEQAEEYSDFEIPIEETKTEEYRIKAPLENNLVKMNHLSEELQKKVNTLYVMNYIYVSLAYTESDEGYGITKFNSMLEANESITDNNEFNRYTIIVKPGIYRDLEERYAGITDTTNLQGIFTKDYVYYESENIYNPSEYVIKWDGKFEK